MTGGTKGGAQRARSLRLRCFGVINPETATPIYLSIYLSIYLILILTTEWQAKSREWMVTLFVYFMNGKIDIFVSPLYLNCLLSYQILQRSGYRVLRHMIWKRDETAWCWDASPTPIPQQKSYGNVRDVATSSVWKRRCSSDRLHAVILARTCVRPKIRWASANPSPSRSTSSVSTA
jgi:hypothetical protein